MAVEVRRGCGYRKKGGIYLVSDTLSAPCDRMPYPLETCPCCGAGVKPARGWTWIDPIKLFGVHLDCRDTWYCPMCNPGHYFTRFEMSPTGVAKFLPNAKAGLLWVGDKFYSPQDFLDEARILGVSRRISALPRGFKVGETWIFLAHSKACHRWDTEATGVDGQFGELEETPGIFCVFRPKKIEHIVDQSEYDAWQKIEARTDDCLDPFTTEEIEAWERLSRAVDRGMTLVPVPDDDPDHH